MLIHGVLAAAVNFIANIQLVFQLCMYYDSL